MEPIAFEVPDEVVDSLPAEGEDAAHDMRVAVDAWEQRVAAVVESEPDDRVDEFLVDALEHLESRRDRYDEFVPELRAWGQSPIFAVAWRNLYASLARQLYEHADVADRVDRERHARLVEDGIRFPRD